MEQIVRIGSTVVYEVFAARHSIVAGKKTLNYDGPIPCHGNDTRTSIVKESGGENDPRILHPGSFSGRALMGLKVGQEVEVNIGGLSIKEMRIGQLSGNHFRYKVMAIY